MRMRPRTAAVLCTFLFAASCGPRGGTDVGNGATIDLGKYRKSSTTTATDSIVLESGVRIDTFWVSVGSLRFKSGAACSDGDADGEKIAFAGQLVGDLVRSDPTPMDALDLASDAYCHVSADVEPVSSPPADAPPGLRDASAFVTGERADGTPFMVRLTGTLKIHLDATSGDEPFELDERDPLVVAFDLDAAIEALDLDSLDGPDIAIDSSTNNAKLSAFANSLRSSAALFRDADTDGVLSDAESSPGKALALGKPD